MLATLIGAAGCGARSVEVMRGGSGKGAHPGVAAGVGLAGDEGQSSCTGAGTRGVNQVTIVRSP